MSKPGGPGAFRVLRGFEAVRLRPAMYVGDVDDGSGLHRMVEFAVLDALARRPARVAVTLHVGGAVSVTDDGGPFPVAIEAALSGLTLYEPGLLAIVCALSSRLDVRVRRSDEEGLTRFADGRLAAPTTRVAAEAAGAASLTEIGFLAARDVFGAAAYDRALVARQLRDLGRREPGAVLTLVDPPSAPWDEGGTRP